MLVVGSDILGPRKRAFALRWASTMYTLSNTITRNASVNKIFEVLSLSRDFKDLGPLLGTLRELDAPNSGPDTSYCVDVP